MDLKDLLSFWRWGSKKKQQTEEAINSMKIPNDAVESIGYGVNNYENDRMSSISQVQKKVDKYHYIIDRPEESREYLQSWSVAGKYLMGMFNQHSQEFDDPHMGFCWLRTDIISPTFDSMNFRYKNKVFSVLLDLVDTVLVSDMEMKNHSQGYGVLSRTKMVSKTTQRQRELQISVCKENDMIPCIFPVAIDSMKPLEDGWNLRNTETGEIVNPMDIADDSPRQVSSWELMNWGISIVKEELQKQGNKVLSFTDTPDIMPQLWFEDDGGNRCWVQVVVNEPMEAVDFSCAEIKEYKGYVAGVTIQPLNGDKAVYRSRPADVEFIGIEAVGE